MLVKRKRNCIILRIVTENTEYRQKKELLLKSLIIEKYLTIVIVTRINERRNMMEQEIKTASEIYNISRQLSMENKKYVIAVANALLFSQGYKKDENCRVSANCSVRAE